MLLVSGAATSMLTGCFHYRWGHPRSSILGGYQHTAINFGTALLDLPQYPAGQMVNYFVFGLNTFGSILAIWLIARSNLLQTLSGRIRALTFVGCFLLGGFIGDSVQQSMHHLKPDGYPPGGFGFSQPFRWPIEFERIPGTRFDDFSVIIADILSIVTIVWVIFPLWVILGFRLSDREPIINAKPKLSIRTFLFWVCTFGGLVGTSLLLTWWASPSSYLSNYSKLETTKDLIFLRIASGFLTGLCVLTMAHAWSLRWPHHMVFAFLAILADGLGHHFIYSSVTVLFGVPVPRYDVFSSPTPLYWSYILGRGIVAWAAFGFASRLGLGFTFSALSPTPKATNEAITIRCNGGRELAFSKW